MNQIPEPKNLLDMVKTSPQFATATDDFARVYRFVTNQSDEIECQQFGAFPDIYEGLTLLTLTPDTSTVAVAIATQGWAAPATDDSTLNDTAPSERPDRERVSLLAVIDKTNRHHTRVHFVNRGETHEDSGDDVGGQLLEALRVALHLSSIDPDEASSMIQSTLADIARLNGDDAPF
jgi:hypothetical protein